MKKNIYGGIFFLALATLVWEILLTRIFSATMHYHFVFLSISLAMLGFGCSGVIVFLFPRTFSRQRCDMQLGLFAALFAAAMCAAVLLFLQLDLSLRASVGSFLRLCVVLVCIFIPYFFSGLAITLALKHYSKFVTSLYCFDLVGAGLGSVLVIALLFVYDGISLVFFTAFLAAVASVLFSRTCSAAPVRRIGRVLALACLAVFLLNAYGYRFLKISSVRGQSEHDVIYEKWNPINRVTVRPKKVGAMDILRIDYDAIDQSDMIAFDGDSSSVQELNTYIKSFYYQVRRNAEILIIGLGGGSDVLAAHINNHRDITAVEINPAIAAISRTVFSDFNGDLFSLPGIRLFVDDGRNHVRRTDRTFDIIQLGNVTSGAGSASGAFTFVENSLYTVEAFKDYYQHLNDGGVLWVTQLRLLNSPLRYLSTFRIVTGLMQALTELEVPQPRKSLVIVEQPGAARFRYACVFLKKGPFGAPELARIDQLVRQMDPAYLYHPDKPVAPNILNDYIRSDDPQALLDRYPHNVAANTDDQPFFYNFLKPAQYLGKIPDDRPLFSTPAFTFRALFAIVCILTAVTIILPLMLFRRVSTHPEPVANRSRHIIYFACLGLGFMLVEIPLIQKFILFLGQPMYAMSAILSSLLVFSGIGSLTAGRFRQAQIAKNLKTVLSAICLLLIAYLFVLPMVFETLLGASMVSRCLAAITLIFPLGLLLGMGFPLGIRILEQDAQTMIPWVWGINGACSVLGSIAAWFVALNFGYTVTICAGVAAYAVACIAMITRRRAPDRAIG